MEYSVIKEGDLFLTTEQNGDIDATHDKGYGLYTKDTRFLSKFDLTINGEKPSLLTSTASKNYVASIRVMKNEDDVGAIEAVRDRFIYDGVLYERLSFLNYFPTRQQFEVALSFDADFQDMFIVRNFRSGEVGEKTGQAVQDRSLSIGYKGKDQVTRESLIEWDQKEKSVNEDGTVTFELGLEPKQETAIVFSITPVIDGHKGTVKPYDEAFHQLESSYHNWVEEGTKVNSDLPLFDDVYQRGAQDLRMLMTDVGYGNVPVAGLPWFAVPFGRDSLITALFMLPYRPDQVKGTLRTLAHYQGTKVDQNRDEQPGKIMHEIRFGELSSTNQTPFTPYYGTNDATALFIVLAVEYYHWTDDIALIKELQPNIDRALEWINTYGNSDGYGYVQYAQEASKGFPNQGWKDSKNSIVHEDGQFADAPIALSEVQGYVYQAKNNLAPIYRELGLEEKATHLENEAETLKNRFEEDFWMEDEKFYAIALDGHKQPVKSITSNPGHVLMSEMLQEERAGHVAERLVAEDLFNGYGVRTMTPQSAGYYPMSYHAGSVWPHDNAMCLIGLSRLGLKEEAIQIVEGMLEASKGFEYLRLPELFCGHDSTLGYPVPYPTTCSPQAWSATSSFIFLQTVLGVQPNSLTKEVKIDPVLPQGMNKLRVEGMSIGEGMLSLTIERNEGDYVITVLKNTTGYSLRKKGKQIQLQS
ncbi:amylo-alpha-1,6-glucosidase [Pontibacillus sp. HMF3514]|uniref:amylo-alpha-1,6-glucosidase n=1 Tax=Pontibacillus sp. HMF3514 TaxID=2692425 RepID=UPI00131F4E83|nr:amylo-alpha-1,6-glucosidase [Pontibacillus sp. HMF3514]QHE54070.1 amylo-alpha-1,6-glucosidase [Pontibacillus sp. HMF3514]